MRTQLASQNNENKDSCVITNIIEPEKLSQYDKAMIEMYMSKINDYTLCIFNSELQSVQFIRALNIKRLELSHCQIVAPMFECNTIKQLKIICCKVYSMKEYQLDNLEVLILFNNNDRKESTELMFEIARFQKLKQLYLTGINININPISQLKDLTKLNLTACEVRDIQALRSLVNIEELSLSQNFGINITPLQFLTKLTGLWLEQCSLINLDTLRPLTKLKELSVYLNEIIYIQPILQMKQLSQLVAKCNTIIDIRTVRQHQNFQNFDLSEQYKPGKVQLKAAQIMRNINRPIIYVRKILKRAKNCKSQCSISRERITECLQKQYCIQVSFLERAVSLLQSQNAIEGQ
ncbi:leucine-rich_repeat domain-containing protein [Hexamita inflata]|uniref:Leucine-rich_repeat domain-containing protein n=1 Tax=Hexamita inflata TaxID=28002 RepID=A0ABP1KJG6_9EUKA